MPNCHEMKSGEIYTCSDCGLELQVVKQCGDPANAPADCGCYQHSSPDNTLSCCGKELVKKKPPSCGCGG